MGYFVINAESTIDGFIIIIIIVVVMILIINYYCSGHTFYSGPRGVVHRVSISIICGVAELDSSG